jgi:hypothetical protein
MLGCQITGSLQYKNDTAGFSITLGTSLVSASFRFIFIHYSYDIILLRSFGEYAIK